MSGATFSNAKDVKHGTQKETGSAKREEGAEGGPSEEPRASEEEGCEEEGREESGASNPHRARSDSGADALSDRTVGTAHLVMGAHID